jgi:hypothetical protein
VIHQHVIANLGSFSNNNTHAVINHDSFADFGTRVDFYSCNPTGDVCKNPRKGS